MQTMQTNKEKQCFSDSYIHLGYLQDSRTLCFKHIEMNYLLFVVFLGSPTTGGRGPTNVNDLFIYPNTRTLLRWSRLKQIIIRVATLWLLYLHLLTRICSIDRIN